MKKILLCCLLLTLCASLAAQTAGQVIDRYITFVGGAGKWKAVRSVVCAGTYNYGGMEFPFRSFATAPDHYKFIVPFNGKSFIQAYDGSKGWKIDAFNGETQRTVLTGKNARAMMNEADVELESPWINYKAKGHRAELEGTDTVNGVRCYRIRLIRKGGEEETGFFSSEDGALLEKLAPSKNTELKNSLLATYYSDYRQVSGLRIPFLSVSKSDGDTILKIILSKVEVNAPVTENEFR